MKSWWSERGTGTGTSDPLRHMCTGFMIKHKSSSSRVHSQSWGSEIAACEYLYMPMFPSKRQRGQAKLISFSGSLKSSDLAEEMLRKQEGVKKKVLKNMLEDTERNWRHLQLMLQTKCKCRLFPSSAAYAICLERMWCSPHAPAHRPYTVPFFQRHLTAALLQHISIRLHYTHYRQRSDSH